MDSSFERWVRTDSIPVEPLDAVVVLSAGMTRAGKLGPAGFERLLSGIEVARANRSRLLLTTRILRVENGVALSSDADQRAIIGSSIDTAQWRVVGRALSTRDEAENTRAILPPAAGQRIAVVTSPMHSRRACATFEGVGYRVVCVPSANRTYTIGRLRDASERFRAFIDWLYERLGMMKYRSRGWIT